MNKYWILAGIFLFTACSAKLIAPLQADADRASMKYPGTTLAELAEGKALFEQHCDRCHPAKKPTSRTEEEWNTIVPKMAKKAKVDSRVENLILKYVVTMGEAKSNP